MEHRKFIEQNSAKIAVTKLHDLQQFLYKFECEKVTVRKKPEICLTCWNTFLVSLPYFFLFFQVCLLLVIFRGNNSPINLRPKRGGNA